MEENNVKTIDKETIIYYYVLKRQYYERYLNTLHEEQTQYEIINNEHDKTYRNVLSDLYEAVEIINEALKLKGNNKIKEEEIEKYNSSFITNQYKNRQADIVYKLKENNTFFLIEHQSKQDYSMPFRLQEYKLEIVKSAIDIKKLKTKEYDIPVVIPIVVYTGNNQWKASINLEQIKDERLKNVDLGKYNVVDMNKYTKEELLKSKQLIDKVYLLEKAKNAKTVEELIKQTIPTLKEETKKQKFINMLMATQRNKIGKEECEKLINNLTGGEEDMMQAMEIVRKEYTRIGKEEAKKEMMQTMEKVRKEYMRMGKKEGIDIVIKMMQEGMTIEEIKKVTQLEKEK